MKPMWHMLHCNLCEVATGLRSDLNVGVFSFALMLNRSKPANQQAREPQYGGRISAGGMPGYLDEPRRMGSDVEMSKIEAFFHLKYFRTTCFIIYRWCCS